MFSQSLPAIQLCTHLYLYILYEWGSHNESRGHTNKKRNHLYSTKLNFRTNLSTFPPLTITYIFSTWLHLGDNIQNPVCSLPFIWRWLSPLRHHCVDRHQWLSIRHSMVDHIYFEPLNTHQYTTEWRNTSGYCPYECPQTDTESKLVVVLQFLSRVVTCSTHLLSSRV